MLTREIIDRVQSLYSKGAPSQSTRLMSRHIYSKMCSVRSTLVFNKSNKKQFLNKYNYTYIPCVEMKLVSGNDCPCIPAPGCKILRSVQKLPKPLNNINGYIIDSVTSVDGATIFSPTTLKARNWRKHDKYTGKNPDYFIKDDYLYVTVTRKLEAVSILALFFDPVEASQFPSKCGTGDTDTCPESPMDINFPIDEDLVDTLIELVVKELMLAFVPKEDVTDNSMDDGEPIRQTQQRRN